MDKTAQYRELIKTLLTKYAELLSRHPEPGVETFLIFDEEREHYLWLQAGWAKHRRVYGITLHMRLDKEKIWIEQDWTEDGIATELLAAGVPQDDIVLAFYQPAVRSMTEFAIA
jgi:hypothetical protein